MNPPEKIKILLIDDDEIIRIYFQDVFWIYGLDKKFELNIVNDIKEGEKIINDPKTKPDIVFLDLVMPIKENGRTVVSPESSFAMLKKIKTDPNLQKIKVIIFSGHSEKSFIDKAKELGAEDYIIKGENMPKEMAEYIEKIAKDYQTNEASH